MNQAEYEFPVSPPDDHEASAASSKSPVTSEPNNMASIPTPSTVTSASPNQRHSVEKVRRDRNPPKNPNGDIYCDHQECSTDPPTFRRPCEWNKHMDRHERPYKCVATGCEMSQGFTYSGGLLRHQREVHKMHLAAKEPLYCPFPGCNRGTGPGFTRKENLEEHKRRRHLGEPAELLNGHARKRKRLMTPQPDINDYDDPDEGENPNDVDVTNHPYVKRFQSEMARKYAEIAEKNNIIRAQAMEIHRLQNVLRHIPTQTIYGVDQNLMSPPASIQRHGGQQMLTRHGSSSLV